MKIKEIGVTGDLKIKEDLTNYIFSVQSLIERLYVMKGKKELDFEYIDVRVEIIEKFEDMILSKLGGFEE